MACFTLSPGLCRKPGRGIAESQLSRVLLGRGVSPGTLLLPLVGILAFRGISAPAFYLSSSLWPWGRTTLSQAIPDLPKDLASSSPSHLSGRRSVHGTSITAPLTHSLQSLLPIKVGLLFLDQKLSYPVPPPRLHTAHCPFSPAGTRVLTHCHTNAHVFPRPAGLSPTSAGRAYLDTSSI